MRLIPFAFVALVAAFLSGCGGEPPEATVYDAPKEASPAPVAAPAPAPPPAPAPAGSMAGQTLPESAVNRAGNPRWCVPAHWAETAGNQMRRASFAVEAPEGAIDIAVTSFPGDVGGSLANVNRWRSQLGLPPVTEGTLGEVERPIPGSHHPAVVAEMSNGETATLAATIQYAGNSWFFKMTGPAAAVAREQPSLLNFVRSVDFHHHH